MWNDSVALLWGSGIVFALIHSLLATPVLKSRIYNMGVSVAAYRLMYVIVATLLTVAWILFLHGLDDTLLYRVEEPLRWVNYGFQGLAIGMFFLSLRPIDVGVFLGLKKFPEGVEPFIEKGIYRYLRHPMYSAAMLLLFSSPDQSINSLHLYLLISVYFAVGARFEEKRLLSAHPEYADYQKRVAMFIPKRLF